MISHFWSTKLDKHQWIQCEHLSIPSTNANFKEKTDVKDIKFSALSPQGMIRVEGTQRLLF